MPNPPCPVGGEWLEPSHHVSEPYVPPGPDCRLLPPTAVACGEPAGTPIVLGLPSRQVLPVSPVALSTVIPDAAAEASTSSIARTVAASTWSSQADQLLLITVTLSSIMALNMA